MHLLGVNYIFSPLFSSCLSPFIFLSLSLFFSFSLSPSLLPLSPSPPSLPPFPFSPSLPLYLHYSAFCTKQFENLIQSLGNTRQQAQETIARATLACDW